MMLGSLGEALPIRGFALESSTVLRLPHDQAIELMLQHPALCRQWLQTCASGMRRHLFEVAPARGTTVLTVLHQSAATRHLAWKLVQRLRELGEEICVLSDADIWRSLPGLQFRSLSDGDRRLDETGIRAQIVEWQHAKRIVFDVAAGSEQGWDEVAMRSDRVLVFVRPSEIQSALRRLRALDVTARGWRDKISLVWLLDEGCNVPPWIPELRDSCSREFSVGESQHSSRWGRVRESRIAVRRRVSGPIVSSPARIRARIVLNPAPSGATKCPPIGRSGSRTVRKCSRTAASGGTRSSIKSMTIPCAISGPRILSGEHGPSPVRFVGLTGER